MTRVQLKNVLIWVGSLLDATFIAFLASKALICFWFHLDTLAALYTCSTALWCISHKVWHIHDKLLKDK